MTLFLDTEFSSLNQDAQLLSLALVSEEGRWLYVEWTDYEEARLSAWHQEHVIPHLFLRQGIRQPDFLDRPGNTLRGDSTSVLEAIEDWLSGYKEIEIWADVLAYDWVFFCELFGGALKLPSSIFYIPFDFATLLKVKGIDPNIPREQLVPNWAGLKSNMRHNALYDAFLLKTAYLKLK